MKKITLIAAVVMAAFTTNAVAQQEATASVVTNAKIVTPISITGVNTLEFGTIAVDGTNGGTVVVKENEAASTTGEVTLVTDASTTDARPATFTVSGQDGFTYAITVPDDEITLSDGASGTMTVGTFTVPATGTLAGGTETITVGATLNVTAGQTPGSYTSAPGDELSVTVYYN